MVKKYLLLFFILIISLHTFSQDSAYINFLLKRIYEQQVKADDYFMPGIFPSYISRHEEFSTKKKDNTIFYNVLTDYVLSDFYNNLSAAGKIIADSIHARTKKILPSFKNQKGRNTYNYWRTDSAFKFPYTWWIPLLRGHVTLPDDMDDTVLGLLANEAPDSSAEALHQLMQQFIHNGSKLKTTFTTYRNYKTYSTWFGKKVPVVFDVCVLSNVLSFVQQYHLPFTAADSAAIALLAKTIESGDYIKHPQFVSPYYGKTSLILYHLSRLMSTGKIEALEKLKPQLLNEAIQQCSHSNNILEKIILSSPLMKWGQSPAAFALPPISEIEKQIEQNPLPFFIGNIPSYLKQPLKENMINRKMLLFYHYCPAWNDALLLEYLLLKHPHPLKGS